MTENRDVFGRRGNEPDLVLSYGPHPEHIADLRRPARTPAPLVLLWHGGFWRSTHDRAHLRPMADALVDAGYLVASVEYRRTGGGGGWPHTFEDVARADAELPELVERALPGEIASVAPLAIGHSAGGHLALWSAARGNAQRSGVLALAPVVDLGEVYRRDLDEGAVAALLGGGPEEHSERYAAADPLAMTTPTAPVTLLHGDADQRVPIELSRNYRRRHGVPLTELAGIGHFELIDPFSTVWPTVLAALPALSR